MAEVKRIDHIGIAVGNLNEARRSLEQNFQAKFLAMSENKDQKYLVAIFQLGESMISLIQSTDESGFIAQFIKEKGEGVQHLGLEVDNLEEFVNDLESKGIRVPVKQMEGDGRREALVGARSAFGVVIQLIEWKEGSNVTPAQRIERMRRYHSQEG